MINLGQIEERLVKSVKNKPETFPISLEVIHKGMY